MRHSRSSQGSARRGRGELGSAVLAVLWEAQEPLSAGEVRDRLARDDDELSYSTVVTILSRLYEKGSLQRRRDGRSFRYAPVADEVGLAARRLSALLDEVVDRQAVLSRFVEELPDDDEVMLRRMLAEVDVDTDPAGS